MRRKTLLDAGKTRTEDWPTFQGRNLLDDYIAAQDGELGKIFKRMTKDNFQESYLGCIPGFPTDKVRSFADDVYEYEDNWGGLVFVSGADSWGEDSDSNFSSLIYFKLNQGKVNVLGTKKYGEGTMMYGRDGGLEFLQKSFPNLIDIRLD